METKLLYFNDVDGSDVDCELFEGKKPELCSTGVYWGLSGVSSGAIAVQYIFINYLDEGTECTARNFADDTNLGGMADTLEGRAAIQ